MSIISKAKRMKWAVAALLFTLIIAVTVTVVTVRADENSFIKDSKEIFRQIQILADSITLVSSDYIEPVKAKDLIHGAIRGMMSTLDGYSSFLDKESFKEMKEDTKGEFAGIGVVIGIRDGVFTIISPIEDTPAFAAGILAGDRVVKIDGEITRDMDFDAAIKMLRGNPGTSVTLTIIREDTDEMFDVPIKRAIIKLKSLKDIKIIEDDIGYVRLIEFQKRTAADLKKALVDFDEKGVKSLILDIRNNPGGLLESSAEVSDLFLDRGSMIVYTEGRDPGKRMEFRAKRDQKFADMTLVILVNNGSASAAEILTGAIKDNERGLIVGTPTFGKGSVQTVIALRDNTALRLTTALYYTPGGVNFRDKGIEPDIYVEKKKYETIEKTTKDKKKKDFFAQLEREGKIPAKEGEEKEDEEEAPVEYDTQLQAAVNILKGVQVFDSYRSAQTTAGQEHTAPTGSVVPEGQESRTDEQSDSD